MVKFNLSVVLASVIIFTGCTKKKSFDEKILYVVKEAKVKGLDPVNAGDTYSSSETSRAYEALLEYHYLKRPYELKPLLAEAMPTVSDDGLTYTFKIKKGVLFHANKCFPDGKGRELVAEDFVYTFKRLADLKNNSTGWWLVDDRLVGLNEWRAKYKGKKANYADKIDGVVALDKYTLQFKLKSQYPQFLYSLAMVYSAAVPKEAVDMYGEEFLNNAVGTGAFMLTKPYTQSNRIEWVKNPTYRDEFYPTEGSAEDKANGLLASAGKKLPLVDKITVMVQSEASTRFLEFEKGNLDYSGIPKDNFDQVVMPDKKIATDYKTKGIDLIMVPDLDITYIAFNNEDPIFKGNTKLRQAMSAAYKHAEANKLFYNNTGDLANGLIPPGIPGYDPNYVNPYTHHNLDKAKKLLAEAGYPEGKGLPTISYDHMATSVGRQIGDLFQQSMKAIGIKIETNGNTWPQLSAKVKTKQTQLFAMAWLGDYPDAENFLQLVWGPNSAPGPNGSNFNHPEFNEKFVKAKNMQPSPERTKLYTELNQLVAEEAPMILGVHRAKIVLKHQWLMNYKFATFNHGHAKYYDVDMNKKEKIIKSGVLQTKAPVKKTASN
jgi:ABC-type transport system substrate-binding protein